MSINQVSTTPAQLRARIAEQCPRLPLYKIAGQIGLHPTLLSRQLNEKEPLDQKVAKRVMEVLELEGTRSV